MQKLFYIFIFFALSALFSSCEDLFDPDIDVQEYESMLVVDGLITNEPGPFEVRLSTSVPLDTSINELPELGASVSISDDQGKTYTLYQQENGWYRTNENNLQAEVGRSYALNIITANGVEYESQVVEMQACPEIDDVQIRNYEKTVFDGVYPKQERWIDIQVNTKGDENDSKYLKWEYEDTWEVRIPNIVNVARNDGSLQEVEVVPNEELRHCWLSGKSNEINVATSDEQNSNDIRKHVIKSMGPGHNMLDIKYSILVKQYSMNKELYTFWKKLEDYNESIGSMFDTTPNSIYGNINCCNQERKVLGYFMASEIKRKRIFIDRSMHTVNTLNGYEECVYDTANWPGYIFFGRNIETNGRIYHPAMWCVSCLEEGTNEKPPFWE